MESFSQRYNNAEIRVDFRDIYPAEKTGLQTNEVNAMAATIMAITSHADHITHIINK